MTGRSALPVSTGWPPVSVQAGPAGRPRTRAAAMALLAMMLIAIAPRPAAATVGIALAVEQLNDDDRRCRLSDAAVRAAAEAGLRDGSAVAVEARSPYLFYLEAGGIPTGEHCAYTLVVRLVHVERLAPPHPLFGPARATLICSDGLRGLDRPGAGVDRVLAGLTQMVSRCAAQAIDPGAEPPAGEPADLPGPLPSLRDA